MKKLILTGLLLASSGAAFAQSGSNDQNCPVEAEPLISRVNVATMSRPSASSAVVQVDLEASSPGGGALSYNFQPDSGSIQSDGSHAVWTVDGEGPFTASVEVSAADSPCKSYANLTYVLEDLNPDDEGE
jgi:hypothetical protein